MLASREESAALTGPHSMHVVGIGRTGAVYVEALLRTGEIEDRLMESGACFAALVVDVGDEDMGIARDYAASFVKRLESRNIPTERFQFQAVVLPRPSDSARGLIESLAFLQDKAPSSAFPGLGAAAPPTDGTSALSHVSRAEAKAIYAEAYYAGERPLDAALSMFAAHVESSSLPSLVTICFSLAGGLGGGIAIDLARHLSNNRLNPKVPVIGVGQLPSTGDPEELQSGAGLYATLNDLDCMLDSEKNAAVVAAWGEAYRGPFTGGFFVVNPEQSWQRLTAYTKTGEKEVRQRFKQMVTNRFVADSFMRLVVIDGGRDLIRALIPSGLAQNSDNDVSGTSRNWTLFDVAKLTHPGVQVLPGEARSKWRSVIGQWIDFTPNYSGLTNGFKTDYAEVFIYASRNMEQEMMEIGFKKMITDNYLLDSDSTLKIFMHEFFDALTAYGNMVLPGVAKTDLAAFWTSQKAYDALSPSEKLNQHAWLVDADAKLSIGSAPLELLAGTAVWGASCWGAVSNASLRGETIPPVVRKATRAHDKLAS